MATSIPANINFAKEEEEISKLWKDLDAFRTCLKQSKGRPKFTFFDGPPFATGLPHYGHILAGTIKDIITRWMHQHGYHVERRFGWDTHGLPVEYEIDKTLGIKGPEDVAKMGIEAYNGECRKIVMRYSKEWEAITTRLGRWIDFENDYKTLYPWYMESIWWVFRQLWDKGLIYQGFRVMPYSTGCATPLSNFEASQNYKEVQDPAVTVSFPLDEDPQINMVAWTTTPWTLPSNLALCVHPELTYVKIKEKASGKFYILMEARLAAVFKNEDDYELLEKFKGSTLKGKGYKPLFDYFGHLKQSSGGGAFRILTDTYVTEESGTGVVHQAPYFGEDDNRVCKAHGVITADQEVVCPLDGVGRFTDPVSDFKGQYVKDADKNIIKKLKEEGRLFHNAQTTHSYPFCWRSDTPLLYRAVPSWFCRVEQMRQTLLERNNETYWVPEAIREGRFANWLRDARDWNLSRNRYWGTPIPVWMSEDGEESICIGSIEELEKLSGVKVADLHRETVDKITIPSKRPGQPPLKRITEVFDCWFESGSMPYAQSHYPFENKKEFEDNFPADFIAEGTDQTRGWFYTLLVLSTALFNKAPFKNLIVNGLVLAGDGQKMSKRKKNYPDPMLVVNKYGADALRLYLINSPVVKAESLRFKEEGVKDVLKDVFLPWFNAYRFLMQNIESYNESSETKFLWDENSSYGNSSNVMDKWIISFTQSLLQFVQKEMAAYRLYTVLPRLMKFIDNLTNWYVRTNRKRLKGEGNASSDCKAALETLFSVLYTMVRVFAPFTPFLTEHMYQRLRHLVAGNKGAGAESGSVHYVMIPAPRKDLIDVGIERAVARMQAVIELGRVLRDRKTMPVKYPLPEVVVIHKDQEVLDDVDSLKSYILDELNVKKLTLSTQKQDYGVMLRAEPDHKTLGFRLKGAFKDVMKEIKALNDQQVTEFVNKGQMEILGHDIGPDDLRIMYSFDAGSAAGKDIAEKYEAHSDNDILILLDCTPDQSMLDEGVAREVINRIQKLRKKAGLAPSDEVTLYYDISPADHDLVRVVADHQETIETTTKNPVRKAAAGSAAGNLLAEESYELKGAKMKLKIVKGFCSDHGNTTLQVYGQPKVKFVNVVHGSRAATVLLENPLGSGSSLSYAQLCDQVQNLFGCSFTKLFSNAERTEEISMASVTTGQTLYTSAQPLAKVSSQGGPSACCPFVDVECEGACATLLLENPAGVSVTQYSNDVIKAVFKLDQVKEVCRGNESVVLSKVKPSNVNGQTLTVKSS